MNLKSDRQREKGGEGEREEGQTEKLVLQDIEACPSYNLIILCM